MSFWTLVYRSLLFYRRTHFAVALGVAAATAVLTGALVVGSSVRGSLRALTLERLGRIDEVVVTDRFFRAQLANELAQTQAFTANYSAIAPVILFPSVTIGQAEGPDRRHVGNVLAIGCDASFWELGAPSAGNDVRPEVLPGKDEIVLNAPLAEALGVAVGDKVTLRLPAANEVPADSPLGRKSERVASAPNLTVTAIIPAQGLGQFGLRPNQTAPRNCYVATETLQRVLKEEGQVNALLIAGKSVSVPPGKEASAALAAALAPTLADFGVRIERITRTFKPQNDNAEQDAEQVAPRTIYDYYHITTNRMIFSPAAARAIREGAGELPLQPVLTYLANTIALAEPPGDGQFGVPYSTITAVDSLPRIGPLLDKQGQPIALAVDEIALNSWTADSLGAKLGDVLRVDYFAPETTHGAAVQTSATFKLAAILPLTEPVSGYSRRGPPEYDQPPTLLNDPDLTPVVQGITDQDSINDWDPPFPFDQSRIRPEDDTYWQNHRTTPKAFISLAAGEKLWGSRFGDVTSFRIPADSVPDLNKLREQILHALQAHQEELGFRFLPVKRQGLEASSGATPFDVLFLFLSFFIIAAALMLVSVLFKLGVDQRLRELGTLLALGWERRRAGWALLSEGVLVSVVGSLLGIVIGVGYAWLMITGLKTWWVGAITTPFLSLHVTWPSLAIGFFSGALVSMLTIAWSLRQVRGVATRQLLGGRVGVEAVAGRRSWLVIALALALFVTALALALLATTLGGEAQAGAFVGGGAAVLTGILLVVWNALRAPRETSVASAARLDLNRLAWGTAQRNPARSTLTIGLMAAATFLIVSMSAFRLDPTLSGAGGFELVATTSEPIFVDLNAPEVRAEFFGDRAPDLAGANIVALRYRPGDDASCNNLYQATQPQILAATPDFIRYYDDPNVTSFAWAATAAASQQEQQNPWHLLGRAAVAADAPIPVVIDKNTAMYSLHLYGGIGEEFPLTYEDGTELKFQVVGLLSNSILQGGLIIGEQDFLARFPSISGYRYFLIQAPPEKIAVVGGALAKRFSDEGFNPESTTKLLAELLRVQNTYLSTFQSLGGLGLLLGVFGLATVQLRSVLERRGELALFRAAGFRAARIARLVLTESVLLLLAGLATGAAAALVAVLPHMIFGGAHVPLAQLALMLGIVLIAGLAASLIAVRATLKADLVGALRGE